ncbi:MAG: hypothetical protein D6760_07420 [Deltaproteobacteria bacterium]|nr:MAG: hypothetical protein D6760_07420 [Deltaproteobacteria bacterium]
MTCFLDVSTRRRGALRGGVSWLAVFVSFLAVAATAVAASDGGRTIPAGELVSYAITPPPGSKQTLVKVPPRGRLLVTQVCTDSPATYVTLGPVGTRISYYQHYACSTFEPGFVVRGGQELRCENRAGTAHGCSVTGRLVRRLPEPPQRAVILEP